MLCIVRIQRKPELVVRVASPVDVRGARRSRLPTDEHRRCPRWISDKIRGIFYRVAVDCTVATPNFDANLLTLMGISSGTSLGFKLPEKQA